MTSPTDIIPAAPVPSRDLRSSIELAIASIEPESAIDDVAGAIMLLDSMKQWEKQQREILMDRLLPYIKANGSFEIGPMKYFATIPKTDLKCRNVDEALEAVFRAAETTTADGEIVIDRAKVISVLSSNAFKPAAAVKLLNDTDGKFFYRPPAKEVVKTEKVEVINTDFIR